MQNLKKNFTKFEGNNWQTQKNMTYMGFKFWENEKCYKFRKMKNVENLENLENLKNAKFEKKFYIF